MAFVNQSEKQKMGWKAHEGQKISAGFLKILALDSKKRQKKYFDISWSLENN